MQPMTLYTVVVKRKLKPINRKYNDQPPQMRNYIIRLDDACGKRHIANWERMEQLLDKYSVKPLVGIIPDCQDPMMAIYEEDPRFIDCIRRWQEKGWTLALHGYQHTYTTTCGGLNPVNPRSEFAGEPLAVQKTKIANGLMILRRQGIEPKVFFAPSHTFDKNTITALLEETEIRIISDTIATKPYTAYGVTFVPQQAGAVRKLPLHTVTFCYHPNTMKEADFAKLECFLKTYSFSEFPLQKSERKMNFADKLIRALYFFRRKL